jgi:carboxypeptidase PM20D1
MNQAQAIKHLQQALTYPTVSYPDRSMMDFPVFAQFIEFLKESYPLLHKTANMTRIQEYSLVFHLQGKTKLKPVAFMAHYDVVPVLDTWTQPAFEGSIQDGYIYGRGTLDMKGHLIALLEAVEDLLSQGTVFERDLYILLGHNEETGSNVIDSGALNTMLYFKEKGIEFDAVLDEGGAFLNGKALGIDGLIALVGIAEKGYLDVELSAKASGGHAAMPPARSALFEVCEAGTKIETQKFNPAFNQATHQMFDHLTPLMKPLYRFLFSHRKWIKPLLLKVLVSNPMTAAIVRTTSVMTMAQGSKAPNVLPQEGKININCRIVPDDSVEDTLKRIQAIVGPKIKVTNKLGTNPTSVSSAQHRVFKHIQSSILSVYPNYKTVAPYLMVAATDSRVYDGLSEVVYRIAPFASMNEDLHTVHADDERLKIEDFYKGIDLFKQLIQLTTQAETSS